VEIKRGNAKKWLGSSKPGKNDLRMALGPIHFYCITV